MAGLKISVVLFGIASSAAFADITPEIAELMHYSDGIEACLDNADRYDKATTCIGLGAQRCMSAQEDGMTTYGMTMCSMAEEAVWDGLLNHHYQMAVHSARALDAEDHVVPLNVEEALRAAQRAWITFRDASCDLDYAIYGDGTLRSIAHASCLMDMTAKRTIELKFLFPWEK